MCKKCLSWLGVWACRRSKTPSRGGTSRVKTTTALSKITVTSDRDGVVSHAGSRLLADLAEVSGLASAYSEAMAGARRRLAGHDPGRVLADLAVMIASGGERISDLAVL